MESQSFCLVFVAHLGIAMNMLKNRSWHLPKGRFFRKETHFPRVSGANS